MFARALSNSTIFPSSSSIRCRNGSSDCSPAKGSDMKVFVQATGGFGQTAHAFRDPPTCIEAAAPSVYRCLDHGGLLRLLRTGAQRLPQRPKMPFVMPAPAHGSLIHRPAHLLRTGRRDRP